MSGISCGFILPGTPGAIWLFANPGCLLQGQLVICSCPMCLSYAWMCSPVGERSVWEHGETRSKGLHSEMAQSHQPSNKCKRKQMWGNFYTHQTGKIKPILGHGVGKWNWMFSSLMERESTSKFPPLVVWKMCKSFDLDVTSLGFYPKQTEKFTKMVVQVHLVR